MFVAAGLLIKICLTAFVGLSQAVRWETFWKLLEQDFCGSHAFPDNKSTCAGDVLFCQPVNIS